MNILVTSTPEHALSYWFPVELVRSAHEACRRLPPSPTTAHPAWNGLLSALGLARTRPRRHPLNRVNRVEVRLTVAERLLLNTLTRLVPELSASLQEEL